MSDNAEKVLKQMYDKYIRTSNNDWQSINTLVGKQLESLGLVTSNILGEFKLTKSGISYLDRKSVV